MRKQTKLVAVLSAAALLAIGASMTSLAATGWTEEDGTWYYYDNNGDRVQNEWRKSSGYWFYLGDDGAMVTSTLIENSDSNDNYFYVNEDGSMATNQWVELDNEDYSGDDDEESMTNWYYFQSNGKAYKAGSNGATSFKTINGKKYAFDSDGKMLYGWVDSSSQRVTGDEAWQSADYYLGDSNDGAMATGWAQIYCVDTREDDEDQNYWFYFKTNGKKTVNTSSTSEITYKTINGKKYGFDEYGVMQDEWSYFNSTASTLASAYNYFNSPEDGHRTQKGWIYAVPSEDFDSTKYNDDEAQWYYADNSGNLAIAQLKTINGKKYAFNTKAAMLSGLQALWIDGNGKITKNLELDTADLMDTLLGKNDSYEYSDGDDTYKLDTCVVYYFGDSTDGAAKTGTVNATIDGDSYTLILKKSGTDKGRGTASGLADSNKILVVNGVKVKADSDSKYEAFAIGSATSYSGADALGKYLVNTSGSIVKSKASGVKDADDFYYITNSNGIVTGVFTKDGSTKEPVAGTV